MDTKITLQQLAKTLAQKKNMSQKKAETFLREFFDAIIQNVTTEKSVKIKGLGTFKLIEVLDRESVNVNTGERIVIPGHSKLSFTPDASLRDMVNKPFADFQTVVINEGTSLEEMEMIPSDSPQKKEENPEPETEPEAEPETEPEVEPETEPEPEVELVSEPEKEPEEDVQVETLYAPQNQQEEEPKEGGKEEEISPQGNAEEAVKMRTMTTAEKWALTLGVVLLCVISYFVGFYRLFGSPTVVPQKKEVKKDAPAHKKVRDKTPAKQKDTVLAVPVVKEDSIEQLVLDPNKKYQITGTRGTHIMKPGDYLTKIAVEEYGNKDFARYIITHNKFRDPDNVPVGTEVKLPKLKPAE